MGINIFKKTSLGSQRIKNTYQNLLLTQFFSDPFDKDFHLFMRSKDKESFKKFLTKGDFEIVSTFNNDDFDFLFNEISEFFNTTPKEINHNPTFSNTSHRK